MSGEPGHLRDVLNEAEHEFKRAGIEDARREARRLVEVALGITRERLITHPNLVLTSAQHEILSHWIGRRAAREPLWRIAGERAFYGRPFRLSKATLEPRPDTETLIDVVLEKVRAGGETARPLRIVDVGAGSGCLLVTLLCELPNATGLGTDISLAALRAAAGNANRHGVADRATWRQMPALEGLAEQFDILVSNPPYVASGEMARLQPEVRLFDPALALDGGHDGLAVYRDIARDLPRIVPRGLAVFEVGLGQHLDVGRIMANAMEGRLAAGISYSTDLAGCIRCVAVSAQ